MVSKYRGSMKKRSAAGSLPGNGAGLVGDHRGAGVTGNHARVAAKRSACKIGTGIYESQDRGSIVLRKVDAS
jgi:hypothetical protein